MKVVLAPDSFKGSLSAEFACRALAEGIGRVDSSVDVVSRPMADGGEGTAAAMMAAMNGQWIPQKVSGPLPGRDVDAGYAWFPAQQAALVEMAAASGLVLVDPHDRNPLRTTTAGTGQLIRAAADRGAKRIWLAVGGSATVDGGMGAARSLGWQFVDAKGQTLVDGGGALVDLHAIRPPSGLPLPPMEVLCDVDNPLLGEHGAARVFGPQKGATPERVEVLERGLTQLADCVERDVGVDVRTLPGGGAAGGLAAGAVAFMNARIVSGASAVSEAVGLPQALIDADWVVTGEGCLDHQSLRGKVVSRVVDVARQRGVRVAVVAGKVELSPDKQKAAGIEVAFATAPAAMPLEEAMRRAEELACTAGERFAQKITSSG